MLLSFRQAKRFYLKRILSIMLYPIYDIRIYIRPLYTSPRRYSKRTSARIRIDEQLFKYFFISCRRTSSSSLKIIFWKSPIQLDSEFFLYTIHVIIFLVSSFDLKLNHTLSAFFVLTKDRSLFTTVLSKRCLQLTFSKPCFCF